MKKLSKKKIQEAIRVVGHLLETNGTTRVFARNKQGKEVNRFDPKACKFCLAGATDVVAFNFLKLRVTDEDSIETFHNSVDNVLKRTFFANPDRYPGPICYWDGSDKKGREQIAMALRVYSDRA
jgi:hypothetical protein